MGEVVLEKIFFPIVDKPIVLLGMKLDESDSVKPGISVIPHPKGKMVIWIIGDKVTEITLTDYEIKRIIDIFKEFLKKVGEEYG